jgi:hypothetical protein
MQDHGHPHRQPFFSRREALVAGGLSLWGLSLADLLRLRAAAATSAPRPPSFGRAMSCVVIFLKGGPSHLDMFDMKPDATAEIRGEFLPIATAVPGMQVSEHLPRLARHADRLFVIRSLSHKDNGHPSGAYQMTTGRAYPRAANLSEISTREDHPHLGSSLAAVEARTRPVPPFVMLPQYLIVNGQFRSGQNAGFLGNRFDPLVPGGDPNAADFRPVDLGLGEAFETARYEPRRALLERVNATRAHLREDATIGDYDGYHAQALDLLAAGRSRQAFDIAAEPTAVRDRYGRSQLGQSVLLARRLVEAGVRLVHVNCMSGIVDPVNNWDSHKDNFKVLGNHLLPRADAAISALLEDLHQRGLLDETLVVVTGEFGRTPKINAAAGRDHWPDAFSVMLAGAGLPGGTYYGATDKNGAYVVDRAITPAAFAATVLHALGVDPGLELPTLVGRPARLADEQPVVELWA